MSFIPTISNEEINELPLGFFDGEVVIIDQWEDINPAVEELQNSSILGFDTETRPSFKKKVIYDLSLIQISNAQKTYLFRVSKTGYTEELYRLMENPDIIKVGASLKDDYKKLFKHRTFDTSSFVDLQVFVKKFDIESMALKKIAAIVLGIRISKSQRLSNWDKEELSEGQIRYAATDAWVCREIYLKLLNQ